MIPSVRQNPTANSKSLPGVRMITANGVASPLGGWMRTSIGSSVTMRSGRSRTAPSLHARTRTDVVGRRVASGVTIRRLPVQVDTSARRVGGKIDVGEHLRRKSPHLDHLH